MLTLEQGGSKEEIYLSLLHYLPFVDGARRRRRRSAREHAIAHGATPFAHPTTLAAAIVLVDEASACVWCGKVKAHIRKLAEIKIRAHSEGPPHQRIRIAAYSRSS